MNLEEMTLDVQQSVVVNGNIDEVFKGLLFRLGEGNTRPDGESLQLNIEPFAGGRWYRDRGEGVQHRQQRSGSDTRAQQHDRAFSGSQNEAAARRADVRAGRRSRHPHSGQQRRRNHVDGDGAASADAHERTARPVESHRARARPVRGRSHHQRRRDDGPRRPQLAAAMRVRWASAVAHELGSHR